MKKHRQNHDPEYPAETFYPSFLFKEIVTMMVIFILVATILAVVFPAGLEDPADPTDNLYVPKPVWYFMPLYQLVKYFPGKLEAIAATIITVGGMLLLLLIPFLDNNSEKSLRKRPIAMAALFIVVMAIIILTIIGFRS